MEILILGTAAAEAWPAPFCLCEACEKARKLGGKNIRTRPNALIDNELKIDFGPDTVMQLIREKRHLRNLKTILFTHQHSDHFVPSELLWAKFPFTRTEPPAGSIELWGNRFVHEGIRDEFAKKQQHKLDYVMKEFAPGDHFTTAAGDEVWAMPADHVEGASVLRIRRNGKTVFWGHDSGLYPAATLDRLSDGITLDAALFDCTYGSERGGRGHLGFETVVEMADELRKRKAITDRTKLIATHFSHGGKWMHDELVEHFRPHGIDVAYDGMIITV
jgi:phosphoribosyl 1,2-cyclic phosphate phosphodiesterase